VSPTPTAAAQLARDQADAQRTRTGTAYGLSAYLLWGLFPLYFRALEPGGAFEILTHRILWTLVLCTVVLGIRREFAWARPLLTSPRALGALGLASVFIAANWTIYLVAVMSGHVTEAALGYFLNPLVTVGLGVVVLGEKLRPLQWVAVAIGVVAAVYLSIDYGRPPWISFCLAFSFAMYGLMKKRIGTSLGALQGLTAEAAILAPVAAVVLGVLTWQGSTTFTVQAPWHALLLVSTGVATAVPLIMFAAAARRVPLVSIGLMQFITPVLQLLCAVLLLGETMSSGRWIGFGIVWVALVVLTLDSLTSARSRSRRLARAAESAAC
jgi:chloramphenicol-sensitive protein RarD